MSLSDVGLRKKLRDMFRKEPEYAVEDYERQKLKCVELFEVLEECVQKHGWNDN